MKEEIKEYIKNFFDENSTAAGWRLVQELHNHFKITKEEANKYVV